MSYYHHRGRHERHYRPARHVSHERQPSPPPPSMSSDQAITILTDVWGADPAAWKPADCNFGHNPDRWPPRMLTALAGLARAAGTGAKQRDAALSLVDKMVKDEQKRDGRLSVKARPEHLNKAAELMERRGAVERSRKPKEDDRRGRVKDERGRTAKEDDGKSSDRDAGRHGGGVRQDRDEGERERRRGDERGRGEEVSFRGAAAEHQKAASRDDARHSRGDRGVGMDMDMKGDESAKPYEPRNRKEPPPAKQEQHLPPKPEPPVTTNAAKTRAEKAVKVHQLALAEKAATEQHESRGIKPPSSPREQAPKREQHTAPKPLPKQEENVVLRSAPVVTTATTTTAVEETAKLHPQRAKRLLKDDNSSRDGGARKKLKLTDANSIPLPATRVTRLSSPQQPPLQQAPIEASQADTAMIDAGSDNTTNASNIPSSTTNITDKPSISDSNSDVSDIKIPGPAFSTTAGSTPTTSKTDHNDNDNPRNMDLVAKIEAELAALRAHIAEQDSRLAAERAALEATRLDLDLSEHARAASEADAAKWRAYGAGTRAILRDHQRLAKIEARAQKAEREAAECRVGMKVAQRMYAEAEAGYAACDVGAERVRVVKGDKALRMANAVLRRENEALRMRLGECGGRVPGGLGGSY